MPLSVCGKGTFDEICFPSIALDAPIACHGNLLPVECSFYSFGTRTSLAKCSPEILSALELATADPDAQVARNATHSLAKLRRVSGEKTKRSEQ